MLWIIKLTKNSFVRSWTQSGIEMILKWVPVLMIDIGKIIPMASKWNRNLSYQYIGTIKSLFPPH